MVMSRRLLTKAGVAGVLACAAVLTGVGAANAGTLPACVGNASDSRQLTASLVKTEAAAGQRQIDYKLTNTSKTACVVVGAPTSAATGTPEGWLPFRTGSTYFTKNAHSSWIPLQPGESAYGEIAWATDGQTFAAPHFVAEWGVTKLAVDLGKVDLPVAGSHFAATNLHSAS